MEIVLNFNSLGFVVSTSDERVDKTAATLSLALAEIRSSSGATDRVGRGPTD